MSIGTAFHNAGTGLQAAARLSENVSNNVANAMTEGYAQRSIVLTSLSAGGNGVRVVGTVRAENAQLTTDRRLMAAGTGAAGTISEAQDRMLAAIGQPGESGSLAARATALETALLSAAASPSSTQKLGQVLSAAKAVVGTINAAAGEAAQIRTDAESEIERQVGILNGALHDIDALNVKIKLGNLRGIETASLEDERSRKIDAISEIVPVRTVKRDGGEVAIYTCSGGALLDGRVWEFSFERTAPVISADMTGDLNGLSQNRGSGLEPVPVNTSNGLMDGGSLAALFEVRDGLATTMLNELDEFSEDLVSRFTVPSMPADALDGGLGVFVDSAPPGTPGIAARIATNDRADPTVEGGELWRLRDGLGSITPGPVGFGGYLQAMADAMTSLQNPGELLSTSADAGAAGLAAEIGAYFGDLAARAEDNRAYLTGQMVALGEREAGVLGVDSDSELQFLMLVEQAYAANAKVLSVVDSLLKQILEI